MAAAVAARPQALLAAAVVVAVGAQRRAPRGPRLRLAPREARRKGRASTCLVSVGMEPPLQLPLPTQLLTRPNGAVVAVVAVALMLNLALLEPPLFLAAAAAAEPTALLAAVVAPVVFP